MKKRVLSLFMALALCLTMLPTAALAQQTGAADVYTTGEDTAVQDKQAAEAVRAAQALIDALPDEVTADNAEEIEAQLIALDEALAALTEEQLAALDMARYEALCAALVSQVSLTAERGGEHADHPICGDVSCNKHGASLTGWVGVSELSDDMEAGYYYLIGPVTRTSTWYPKDGVVLCLNGYNISMDAKNSNNDSTICVNGGVTFTLCDCQNKGTVTHGMNGTAKYTGSGVWVENGNRAGKANFVLYSGSVSGNEYDNASIKFGAGVHLGADASFTMHGGGISGNKTAGYGGGVYVQAGTTSFTMTGGTITGNSAGHDGGGVYVKNGSFTMTGGSITENRVGSGCNGGGVYADINANVTLSGAPVITENKDADGTVNNVYLDKDEVYGEGGTFIGEGGLSSTSSIGVTVDAGRMPTTDGGYTTIAEAAEGYTITADDAKRVSADAGTGYSVRQKDNALVLVKGELPHEHPICGKTCGHTGNEKHTDDIEWKPVSSLSDITEAGSYYLTKDVETSGTWELTDGVNLCLNGHSIKCTNTAEYYPVISIKENITFTLTDCEGGETPHTFKKDDTGRWVQDASGEITVKGVIFRATDVSGRGVGVSGGTFNMYGGTVCGGSLGSGGGVHVSSGTFNMYGGRISGNVSKDTSDGGGGGVYVCNSSTFNMSGNAAVSGNTAQYGSGVYLSSNSTFTMSEHAAISGNSAGNNGGGIYISYPGTFTMENGTISGNSADKNGGGVYVHNSGAFTMNSGSISGNRATQNGGGVYVKNGTFTMSGGKVTGNSATEGGGGVRLDKGTFNMSGSAVISRNTADGYGGGVDVNNGSFTMSGGSITGNTTTGDDANFCGGGGVDVYNGGSFTMSGGSITGNNSLRGGGVELNGSGTMTVSGSVQITDNWQNGTLDSSGVYVKGSKGKANNLYLYSTKTVAIDTAGLNADARIGISTEDWPDPGSPVKIATNATNKESHYTAIFTPDAEEADYKITKKNDNALYLSAHEHTWTYTADAATHTITAKCSECQQTGGSVTLQAPDESTLTYDGNGKAATVTASSNWQGPAVSGITIGYTYEVNGHPTMLSPGEAPINARAYTASITLGGKEVSVQYTINKAELTIKANDNTIVYGDTASDKGVTYSGFVNGEHESVLGGELTYTFSYTPGMDKGLYIITPEGKTSGNYEIKTVPGTLTVEPREVTLTWHDYENRTYGDGKYVYATAGNLLEADVGKVVVELSGNAANASGTFTAIAERLTGDKADNYKLPENATKEYTIGRAEQTLTFAKTGDQSVTYGNTLENPATNNRADGSAVTYTSSDPAVATVDANGKVTAKKVGKATITATAEAMNGKYSKATANYKLTVTKRPISLTITPVTYYYGQPGVSFTPSLRTVSGSLAEGDDYKTLKLSWSSVGTMWKAGTFDVKATSYNSNYNVTFDGTGKLIVLPRPITVTVDAASRVYGDADPAFTAQQTGGMGFVNGETVASLGLSLSSTATATSPVGSYNVTGTASNGNYAVTVAGTDALTVTAKPITVTVNEATRPYGEANPTFTATALPGALVGEDAIASLGLSLSAPTATTTSDVGKYDVTGSANNANYKVTIDGAGKLTVAKKELTENDLVFADTPITKAYDGKTDATVTVQIKDSAKVKEGDVLPTVTGTATYNSKDVQTANKVTFVTAKTESANYILPADLTREHEASITKRVLTVGKADTKPKTFDGNNNATFYVTSVALDNLADGETLTMDATGAPGDYGIYDTRFDSANVGSRTVTGTVALLSRVTNYTFEDADGNPTDTATFTGDGEIVKASARDLGTVRLEQRYTDTDEKEYLPDYKALMPANAGKLTYDVSYEVTKGTASVGKNDKEEATGKLTYQISAQAGAEIT